MLTRRFLIAAAVVISAAGCAHRAEPVSVADTVARTPNLSTLNGMLAKTGLTDALRAPGPFTLFAPTDEAFKAVKPATLADWEKHPEKLKALLSQHVVPGKLMAADIKTGNVKSLSGANVALSRAGEFVTIEDAMAQTADIAATNGVVHVIDTVLTPAK